MVESHDSAALKDAMNFASPVIKALVETLVVPKLKKISEQFKGSKKAVLPTEENFIEYYLRTYKKLAIVNTLVFKNAQRFLSDIYLPLTLISANDRSFKLRINGYPSDLSDTYHNILITDTAGMGKSTLMKKIFIDAIFQNHGIPIFIELRRLNKAKTILQEIQEELSSLKKKIDPEMLMEILSDGQFIIILDGYDEISLNDREQVTKDLQQFISKANNNRFFITSRPENALASFGNFYEFRIQPLIKKEAYELLRKYDNNGNISKLLTKKLEESDMQNIKEFLVNPLLVSLLYTAFEHKQAIPFKKYLFYRQVYDANFEAHDLTKGDSYIHDKYSKLEIDDFHSVLRHIGYNCFKLQRIEFSKDELLRLIKEAKSFCAGLIFKESDFLQDIIKTVPLFAQDGNYYKWSHKSLQEYFAAQFIQMDSKEKQSIILNRMYSHENLDKFINVLDLYYDMDYKSFRNIIEFNFLTEYLDYCSNNFNNDYPNIPPEAVLVRKEIMFLFESFVFTVFKISKDTIFNEKKLNTMLEDCQSQYNDPDFQGLIMNLIGHENVFCIHNQFRKANLYPLFANKKNSIVHRFQRESDKTYNLEYEFQEEYIATKISDCPNLGFNSLANFSSITDLIKLTRHFKYSINNNEAIKKHQQIKRELEMEKVDSQSMEDF